MRTKYRFMIDFFNEADIARFFFELKEKGIVPRHMDLYKASTYTFGNGIMEHSYIARARKLRKNTGKE